ncbi:hypothetical protein BD410DRAFT_783382 [Rickenella mellea]|uniref:TPX2 C-terminal domain-containing protein n=1 Tax=Rickenella mellea TaxID=50990 RepID=A0A4Y7QHP8_9AGAM|nr:hypothetical protein BD410DRAFT_783382 [Rickenella mellea]
MKKSRKRVSSQVPDENIQYGPKRTKSAVRTGVSRSDVPAKHHRPPTAAHKANKEFNGAHTRALQSSNTINAGTTNTTSRVLGAGPRRRRDATATLQQSGETANAVASTSRLSNTVRSTYAVASDQDAGEMKGSQNLPRRQPQASRTSLAEDKYRLRTMERSEGSRQQEDWDVELTQVKEVPDLDKPVEPVPRRPVKSTVPQEFRFQSDLRVEARRREFDDKLKVWQKRENHNSLNVPDFKALHAAYEASLAAKRKHVVPVIPAPLQLSTAARVKERARFDEARRIREEEIKRQMDEMRKVREADEEREVRELRKRAIPKANPVPYWYADVPKTNSKSASTRT